MTLVWNVCPRGFQSRVAPLIIRMIAQNYFPSEEILLARVMVSEKSSSYQAYSIVDTDATTIVEPTMSLSSDQLSKQNSTSIPS